MNTEDLKFFGRVIGIILLMSIIVLTSVALINRKICLEQYSNYQPEWGIFSNCRVIWNETMTPVSMVKNINLNK